MRAMRALVLSVGAVAAALFTEAWGGRGPVAAGAGETTGADGAGSSRTFPTGTVGAAVEGLASLRGAEGTGAGAVAAGCEGAGAGCGIGLPRPSMFPMK